MTLVNAMEAIIQDLFTEYQKNSPLSCNCQKCQEDILAIALNHLGPRYVATESGEVQVKTHFMDLQLQSDVLRELSKAAEIVRKNPKHDIEVK